jgi:ABC-type xylose transport system permease subunit
MILSRFIRHETILGLLTVLALIVLAMQSDKFFTTDNLLNQGRLMAEIGIVALAMTFVVVTGGIDLSVGSILGLTAILLGVFWKNVGLPLPLAVILAVASGTFAGLMNGVIITKFKVPPLIATLATLALYRGLAEGISQARSVRGYPEWFYFFGQGEILGVPLQLWLLVIVAIIAGVILGLDVRPTPLVPTKPPRIFQAFASTRQNYGSTEYQDFWLRLQLWFLCRASRQHDLIWVRGLNWTPSRPWYLAAQVFLVAKERS